MQAARQEIAANVRGESLYRAFASVVSKRADAFLEMLSLLLAGCLQAVVEIGQQHKLLQRFESPSPPNFQKRIQEMVNWDLSSASFAAASMDVDTDMHECEDLGQVSVELIRHVCAAIHARQCTAAAREVARQLADRQLAFDLRIEEQKFSESLPETDVDIGDDTMVTVANETDSLADLVCKLESASQEHHRLAQSLQTLDSAVAGLSKGLESLALRVWRDRRWAAAASGLNQRLENAQKQIAELRQESAAGLGSERLLSGTLEHGRLLATECAWLQLHSSEAAQQRALPALVGAIDTTSVDEVVQKLKQTISQDFAGDGKDAAMAQELQKYENTTVALIRRAASMRITLLHLGAAVTEFVRALNLCELSRADSLHALHNEEKALKHLQRLAAVHRALVESSALVASGVQHSTPIVQQLQNVEADFSHLRSISGAEHGSSTMWSKCLEAASVLGAADAAAAVRSADATQNLNGSDKSGQQPQIDTLQKSVSKGVRSCEEALSTTPAIKRASRTINLPPEIAVEELFPNLDAIDPDIERTENLDSLVPYMLARQKAVDSCCAIARFRTEIFANKVDLAALMRLTAEFQVLLSCTASAEEATTQQHALTRPADALQDERRSLQQKIAQQASGKDRLLIERHTVERAKEKSLQKQRSEAERVKQLQKKLQSMAPDERQRLIESLTGQLQKAKEDLAAAEEERDKTKNACNSEMQQRKKKQIELTQSQEALRSQIKARRKEAKDAQDEWKKKEEPLTKRARIAIKLFQENKTHLEKSTEQKKRLLETEQRKVATWKAKVGPKLTAVEKAKAAFQDEEASRANAISQLEDKFKKIREEYRSIITRLSAEDKAALQNKEASLKKKTAPAVKAGKPAEAPKAVEATPTA